MKEARLQVLEAQLSESEGSEQCTHATEKNGGEHEFNRGLV